MGDFGFEGFKSGVCAHDGGLEGTAGISGGAPGKGK